MTEETIRTRFETLPDGFQIVMEHDIDGIWNEKGKAVFWSEVPGVIQIHGKEGDAGCNIPLNHEQTIALANGLRDLVAYSERAVETLQKAQFICPDCAHHGMPEKSSEHPCYTCGEPDWKNFIQRES